MPEQPAPIVVKIGGSVLTSPRAYARAARWLADRVLGPPLLVVVSAEQGTTDRLLAEAQAIARKRSGAKGPPRATEPGGVQGSPPEEMQEPDTRTRDLLWATGELRSAALLALRLQARGVPACALNVHETGLHTIDNGLSVRTGELRKALESHAVTVVPGFLGSSARGAIVSLGRGGSDLTAVTLAAALGASRCELIKDVPGYFTADPAADSAARHLPCVGYDTAIAMAADGCPLVQADALHMARTRGVRLLITTIRAGDRHTIVSAQGDQHHAFRHEDHSCRAAVGA